MKTKEHSISAVILDRCKINLCSPKWNKVQSCVSEHESFQYRGAELRARNSLESHPVPCLWSSSFHIYDLVLLIKADFMDNISIKIFFDENLSFKQNQNM